eukprot:359832-Chlamydomonas_euryale.AAC.4
MRQACVGGSYSVSSFPVPVMLAWLALHLARRNITTAQVLSRPWPLNTATSPPRRRAGPGTPNREASSAAQANAVDVHTTAAEMARFFPCSLVLKKSMKSPQAPSKAERMLDSQDY